MPNSTLRYTKEQLSQAQDVEAARHTVALVDTMNWPSASSKRVAPLPSLEPEPEPEPIAAQVQLMQPPTAAPALSSGPKPLASRATMLALSGEPAQPAKLGKDLPERVINDAVDINRALRSKSRFHYMASDSVCVHGLRDWNLSEWQAHLERHPEAARQFLAEFLPGHDASADGSWAEAARLCKARLDLALEAREWDAVVRFQNLISQREGAREGHTAQYLEPSLLWNFAFNRDFPLGLEERLVEEPWRFAVDHSGVREVGHRKNSAVSLGVYLAMFALLVAGLYYMSSLMAGKPALWTLREGTVQDASDAALTALINSRTKDRGTVASCLQAPPPRSIATSTHPPSSSTTTCSATSTTSPILPPAVARILADGQRVPRQVKLYRPHRPLSHATPPSPSPAACS